MTTKTQTSKSTTLLDRCRSGNDWCTLAWERACEAADDQPEWCRRLELFRRGTAKLNNLCLELEASGFEECLYDTARCQRADDITCWACPTKTAHWLQVVSK